MRKTVLWVLFSIFATLNLFDTRTVAAVEESNLSLSPAEIFWKVADATVFITTQGVNGGAGQGSGFVISPDGIILTAYHVIAGSETIMVRLKNGSVYPASRIVHYDRLRDICALKIETSHLSYMTLSKTEAFEIGQKVYVIGNPLGLEYTISDGLLSGYREQGYLKRLQISAPVSPGNSGGPLINTDGEAIGIVASSIVEGQNLNFAVPVKEINTVLQNNDLALTAAEFAEKVAPADHFYYQGVKAIEDGTVGLAVEYFEKALEIEPALAEAYAQICMLHLNSTDLDNAHYAVKNAAWAVRLKPEDYYYQLLSGAAYGGRFHLSKAEADAENALYHLNEAIRLNPQNILAYQERARVHSNNNQINLAEDDFKTVLSMDPSWAIAYEGLGIIYEGQGDWARAKEFYEKALGLEPSLDISRRGLTLFYIENGNKAAAEKEINKIRDYTVKHEAEQRYNARFGGMAPDNYAFAEERSIPDTFFRIIVPSFFSGAWDLVGNMFWHLIFGIFVSYVLYIYFLAVKKQSPPDKTVPQERSVPMPDPSRETSKTSEPVNVGKPSCAGGGGVDHLSGAIPAKEICNWAVVCHLTALTTYIGIPFGGILGPLLTWLLKRHDAVFIDEHGKEALNFHITITLYGIGVILLCFIFIGFPLLFALIVVDLMNTVKGAIAASNGRSYRYPMSVRFLK